MSFDKTVKNACKPKKDPPKSKYLEPIINATHTTDGAIVDICKSLGSCLREPKNIVIFKALIVLHSMIRQGATDNVLTFLSNNDVLRLRDNVGNQTWEGYSASKTLQSYAMYLESRIHGYKALKHDPIRVQSENNRKSQYEGSSGRTGKLNSLTVDKGLLREVREVQKIVACLIQCRFFDDDLEDPCSNMACRMIVKDLLVLTQAVNEGVVNLLEHYFEMVKTDAQEALSIYKAFVKQNDKVVDYLNTARRLKNVLDVPVPNLKHAPVSLVRALEEYLHDPNFEQNRLEYRQNMSAADVPASTRAPSASPAPPAPKPAESSRPAASSSTLAPPVSTSSTSAPAPTAQRQVNRTIQDFLSSIEEEQKQQQQQMPGMGGGNSFMGMGQMNTANPYAQSQQPMANPFRQSMFPQATGFNPMQAQATGFPNQQPLQQPNMQMMPQQTGFMQPQATPQQQPQQNAFIQPQQAGFGQPAPFAQPQQTGFQQAPFSQPAPLQPQATGFNPFRQSMMMPQNTGLPFRSPSENAFTSMPRSTSAPLNSSNTEPKPLTAQATGTNNPFALPSDRVPKKQAPAGPSLFELAMHKSMSNNIQQQQQTEQVETLQGNAPAPMVPQATGFAGSSIVPFSSRMGNSTLGQSSGANAQASQTTGMPSNSAGASSAGNNSNSFMSDLASAFAVTSTNDTSKSPSNNATGSNNFGSAFGSSGLFNQSTGATNTSSNNLFGQTTGTTAISSPPPATPSSTAGFLQPQATGFAGSSIKPFKPSSNFGSTLVTDMPSSSLSPNQTGFGGLPTQSTGASPSSPFGAGFGSAFGGQGQGQGQGQSQAGGMKPQATGYNPFGSSQGMGNSGNNNDTDLMSIFGGGSGQQQQQQPQQSAGSPFGQPFGNTNRQTGNQQTNTNWMTSF